MLTTKIIAMANAKKKKEDKGDGTFVPKNHKDLVEWYCNEILSGTATRRDFLTKAKMLEPKKKEKKD